MEIDIFQVDAFTNRLFEGNPAAIVLLESWLSDDLLQKIAQENNLSETAFIVPRDHNYHIRWFTPLTEVELCGHATLAAGYVVLKLLSQKREHITFHSLSGPIDVHLDGDQGFTIDLPVQNYTACETPDLMIKGLGVKPLECYRSKDYLVTLETEKQVRDLTPDFRIISQLNLPGVIVTAKGDHIDFVSRYFAPQEGINEDPVTGSSHCVLIPYWSEKLGKHKLHAKQLSERKGDIYCELKGDRVNLKGHAVLYMKGTIHLF